MRDAEFRAMLQASKERNKHNSYAYTDTPASYELPSDKYCANLTTICMKVIEAINHHAEMGNISLTTSEPDFEFDVYAQAEGF
ncbi:hypothetical protein [Escherichia coli]|uniref:hypothetical protein n=1 Tax=Escherichia coli TaxID=562 RepID=UPI001376DF59|nr:hypothetical protein [Escherichia coli]NBE10426.1 hypothetical protein [Escherichia coli]